MKQMLLAVSIMASLLFLKENCYSIESGSPYSLVSRDDIMANRRGLANVANTFDGGGVADRRTMATTDGGIESKKKPSKSKKGKSLKKSSKKTSKSSKSGKGGKEGKSGYHTDNLLPTPAPTCLECDDIPTPAPTCLECDDIMAYQQTSSSNIYRHDKASEATTRGGPSKAFLAIGSILLVLAFIKLSLVIVAFLDRKKKDSFMEAVHHEERANRTNFSENDVTYDEDDEEDWEDSDPVSGAP
jgi:hypothetical protein